MAFSIISNLEKLSVQLKQIRCMWFSMQKLLANNKGCSQGKSTLKLNSSAYEKYEY